MGRDKSRCDMALPSGGLRGLVPEGHQCRGQRARYAEPHGSTLPSGRARPARGTALWATISHGTESKSLSIENGGDIPAMKRKTVRGAIYRNLGVVFLRRVDTF